MTNLPDRTSTRSRLSRVPVSLASAPGSAGGWAGAGLAIVLAGIPITFEALPVAIGLFVAGALLIALAVARLFAERAHQPKTDRVLLLRQRYTEGRTLEGALPWIAANTDWSEAQHEADKRAERQVCDWGKGTWLVLKQHFSAYEQDFFGPGDNMGEWSFALSCSAEIADLNGSADRYLKQKLAFLIALLRQYDAVAPAGGLDTPAISDAPSDAAAFKDFAHSFVGWFKAREIVAPPDMTDILGAEYESEQGRALTSGAISPQEYQDSVRPFTERQEWVRRVRAEYQDEWRAPVARHLDWAHRSGAMTNEDLLLTVYVNNPQEDTLKELAQGIERMAARL